ncbi:MAG TPA: hypothetical protein VHS58_07385 [Acetobacteraceae bacterium]|jgi:hypothetical protein|nr:hypothetical protein [Acetobacteraceae bacterium]
MSDIGISFPFWVMPLLIGALYWPVFLGFAVVFALLAVITRRRIRITMLVLSFLALLPILFIPVVGLVSEIAHSRDRAAWARTHETLSAARRIGGLDVPTGTEVTWTDDAHSGVAALEFAGPATLLGVMLAGRLENVDGRWWSGTLAEATRIDGWDCAAGDVWLSPEAHLMRCVLASGGADRGLAIPAGTEVAIAPSHHVGELRLPTDRTMALPPIGATLPPGGSLFFRADGVVERAYAPSGTTLRVGGIDLQYDVVWTDLHPPANADPGADLQRPNSVRGELASDATLDGAVVPAGTMVDVDITTGTAHTLPKR